ncbi:MAG: hypothetical protein K2W96_15275, partial [Gemmataceae bacterium]|nr:hypothetical protein [Gemmataceae bacterium]
MHALRLSLLCLAIAAVSAPAQMTPDQQAKTLLDTARRAFNDKQFPFAATKFREFVQKFGGHKDANAARYGLGLSLLDGPERNFETAANELAPLLGAKTMPEHPFVLYHFALARRGQGTASLATAQAKPAEANAHREQARGRFEEAGKQFLAASAVFLEKGKDAKPGAPELEWALRSRIDAAEMLLRQRKPKEARAALDLLAGEGAKRWEKSKYLD